MSIFRDVYWFHRAMNILQGDRPLAPLQGELPPSTFPYVYVLRRWRAALLEGAPSEAARRFAWLFEELAEALEAHQRGDLAAQADARIDLIYFAAGDLDLMGVTPGTAEKLWDEVHRANLAKTPLDPTDLIGKIRKPKGWIPPQVQEILDRRQP